MGRRGKTAICAVIIAMILTINLALPAMAAGTGIALAPNSVQIIDALRGAEYGRSLVLTNMGGTAMDYTVTAGARRPNGCLSIIWRDGTEGHRPGTVPGGF
jgi:hypothetical protein